MTAEARIDPQIVARVQKVLMDQLGVDESAVQLDTDIQRELQPDSLDVIEYVMSLEEEFDVEI